MKEEMSKGIELNKIYNEDCLETMKRMPDGFVDCVITSPPYEDIAGSGYTANSKDVLFLKLYSEFIDKLFIEYYRILKDGGQIFFNIKSKTANKTVRTPHWLEFTEGFKRFDLKSYIVWKYAGSFDSTEARFHLDYEVIYHLSKGDIILEPSPELNDPLTSVWYIPHNIKDRVHPTQMPEKVVENILSRSGVNGLIYDSFMGSGTTAIVCKRKGVNYVGSELNPKYCKIAEKRIKQEYLF